jgi:GAF domain-containing protein
MTESLITIIVALITAIFGPLLIEWVKLKISNKSNKSPIQEAVELNELVDEQLDTIIEQIPCDRVWIAQFHNGGHFYPTGKSIQKFSFFYEKVNLNIASIQYIFQNIPVSLFPKFLGKIYKDSEISIPSYNGEYEIYDSNIFSTEYDTKSFYAVGLYSLDNHLIGIMGISFTQNEHKLNKEEWIFIRQKVGAIGTLLTEYLKTTKK